MAVTSQWVFENVNRETELKAHNYLGNVSSVRTWYKRDNWYVTRSRVTDTPGSQLGVRTSSLPGYNGGVTKTQLAPSGRRFQCVQDNMSYPWGGATWGRQTQTWTVQTAWRFDFTESI